MEDIGRNRFAVSIHAPVWGATRQGGVVGGVSRVSIHAPVWGATDDPHVLPSILRSFNPRSRMGSDSEDSVDFSLIPVSIHAPVWGATEYSSSPTVLLRCFNPRSRMGSDLLRSCFRCLRPSFQSTLPYGERRWKFRRFFNLHRFQSTLPYGERPAFRLSESLSRMVSIHAPVWGATQWDC